MEAARQQPTDTQHMEQAFSMAAEAAAQVHRTVFNAVMQCDTDEWQHSRYLLNLNYDSQGRPTQPHAQPIALSIQKAPDRGFCSVLWLGGPKHLSHFGCVVRQGKHCAK